MNIYFHELKRYRKSIIIWTVSLTVIAVFYLSIYPAFTKDVDAVKKIFEAYPPALRAALGMGELENFFSVLGFYSFIFTYILLTGAIQGMNMGTGILSKENAGKTSDFLFSKPVSRNRVLTEKLFAGLTCLAVTNLIFIAVVLPVAISVSSGSLDMGKFMLITLSLPFVQLVFFFLGFLIAVIIHKIKTVVAISLPVVFGFFIVGMLGEVVGNEEVRYLTPFKFIDYVYVLKNSAYEARFIVIGIIAIILSIVLTYIIFNKKDIDAPA